MSDRQASCAERIDEHMAGREAQFRKYFVDVNDLDDDEVVEAAKELDWTPEEYDAEVWDSPEEHAEEMVDEAREYLSRHLDEDRDEHIGNDILAVSASVTVTLRVELSTGGPADFLTAELDPSDGTVSDVTYHFQDWFDGAKTHVSSHSPLYSLVERYASMYAGLSYDEIEDR